MAKAFSDTEKVLIKEKLKKGAIECIQRYGIRKTSVDELVKYAGISKGAFYLFYESKELLFFDAVMEYHQQLQDTVSYSIHSKKGKITPDILTEALFKVIKDNQLFWTSLLVKGDLEYIQRKLSEQMSDIHIFDDDKFFGQLLETADTTQNVNVEVLSGTIRAIFLTILHIETIGKEVFDDVLKMLLKSVFQQIFDTSES